ncbi:MAG: hypothetical protein VSS75_030985 [Candidatus Parabeggiatoa sp.]|nr:hypothetical protein [Candidatus Parabeggiatoa sp.]
MKIGLCCKLMIVVTVIAVLTAVIIPTYYCDGDHVKKSELPLDNAKVLPLNDVKLVLSDIMSSFSQVKNGINTYRMDAGGYPQTLEEVGLGFTSSDYVKTIDYTAATATAGPTVCFNLVDDLGKIGFTNVKGYWSCKQSDVQSVEPNCTPYIKYLPKSCTKK